MVSISIDQVRTRAETAAAQALFVEYLEVLNTDFGKAVGCADSQADMQDFPAGYAALFWRIWTVRQSRLVVSFALTSRTAN